MNWDGNQAGHPDTSHDLWTVDAWPLDSLDLSDG